MVTYNIKYIISRWAALVGGLFWVKYEYVSTEEGDYSKWLGPDWKPEWSGASTIVSNHVSWLDICISYGKF